MLDRIKSVIYNTIWYSKYDRLKTNRLRKKLTSKGLKPACDFDWSSHKKSDTLFILGSGGTVMSHTDENWDFVKSCDSIGFNGWVFHDFTPTYYGIESMPNDKVFKWYIDALVSKKDEYSDMPIFVQSQHMIMNKKNFDYPGLVQKNIFYNTPYMPNTTNSKVLSRIIRDWVNRPHSNFSELFHYAGSLSYAIGMGYIMGYKKIVLLGVDLTSSKYFYEYPNAGVLAKKFNDFQNQRPKNEKWDRKQVHKTISKKVTAKFGCLPISVLVEEMQKEMRKKGVELYIGSTESALYPMLDLFEFPSD